MDTMERPRKLRRDCQALVVSVRCGPGRGLAAVRLIDEPGGAAEHFLPFAVNELPSRLGHDFTYAGLISSLERLRSLAVRRVLLQTDDEAVVAEMDRRLIAQVRNTWQFYRDRRPDMYGALVQP